MAWPDPQPIGRPGASAGLVLHFARCFATLKLGHTRALCECGESNGSGFGFVLVLVLPAIDPPLAVPWVLRDAQLPVRARDTPLPACVVIHSYRLELVAAEFPPHAAPGSASNHK